MESREKLTKDLARRQAALGKQTAEGSKATPDHVRRTRKLLKRAHRRLVKLARSEKILKGKAAAAQDAEKKPAAAPAAPAAPAAAAAPAAPAKPAEEKKA
jgi:uncharacterized protein with gpF-like domain